MSEQMITIYILLVTQLFIAITAIATAVIALTKSVEYFHINLRRSMKHSEQISSVQADTTAIKNEVAVLKNGRNHEVTTT